MCDFMASTVRSNGKHAGYDYLVNFDDVTPVNLEAADRLLETVNIDGLEEGALVEFMRDCGYDYANYGSPLTPREQVAFAIHSVGITAATHRLLEAVGVEQVVYEDPAVVEFHIRLTDELWRQSTTLEKRPISNRLERIAFDDIAPACAKLSVEVTPNVTRDGSLVLEWRDGNAAQSATFFEQDEQVWVRRESPDASWTTTYVPGLPAIRLIEGH